jgi:hypothetical protein
MRFALIVFALVVACGKSTPKTGKERLLAELGEVDRDLASKDMNKARGALQTLERLALTRENKLQWAGELETFIGPSDWDDGARAKLAALQAKAGETTKNVQKASDERVEYQKTASKAWSAALGPQLSSLDVGKLPRLDLSKMESIMRSGPEKWIIWDGAANELSHEVTFNDRHKMGMPDQPALVIAATVTRQKVGEYHDQIVGGIAQGSATGAAFSEHAVVIVGTWQPPGTLAPIGAVTLDAAAPNATTETGNAAGETHWKWDIQEAANHIN